MNRFCKFGVAVIAVLVAGGQGYGGYGGYGEPLPGTGGTGTGGTGAATAPVLATLTAVVGPGFTITLKKGTANVTSLKAGKYKINVDDRSTAHNFHLLGGTGTTKIDKKTTLVFKGKAPAWTVTFKKGVTYTYKCDPHPTMKKTFKAT